MEAGYVVGTLLGLFFVIGSVSAANEYSEEKYKYKVFNLGISFSYLTALIALVAAILSVPDGYTASQAFTGDGEIFENCQFYLFTAVCIWGAASYWVVKQSDIWIGGYAAFIQSLFAPIAFAVAVLGVAFVSDRLKNKD